MFASRADLIIKLDAHHMREDGPGVGAKLWRVLAKLEFLRQHGSNPGAVDQITRLELLLLVRDERDAVIPYVDVGNPGLLTNPCAVPDGDGHHVGIHILPEEMQVRPHGRGQRRILMGLGWNLFAPLRLVQKTERSLDPAGGADVVADRMKRAQVRDLGHIVLQAQQLEPKVRIGRGRFSDREARMRLGVDHQNFELLTRQNRSQHRATDSGTQHDHVVSIALMLHMSSPSSPLVPSANPCLLAVRRDDAAELSEDGRSPLL